MKPGFHARRLIKLLTEKGKSLSPLTILTHDHPDPDALASAWALAHLAQTVGKIQTRIVYGGIIGRAENRIMAERLLVPARPLRKGELAGVKHLALVDTQPPFKNNRCPPRRNLDRRHDRRLGSPAARFPRRRFVANNERSPRVKSRRLRHFVQASEHDRVGIGSVFLVVS